MDTDIIYDWDSTTIDDMEYYVFQYCYIEHTESNPMDAITTIAWLYVNQQDGKIYYNFSYPGKEPLEEFIKGSTD
ncbi:hypothetical protein [Lachnotalea glycerini]|uniref:Uncharacterized protein n=1 Tax=Lachnotalea glycerini TaxID=1763509 RepID=A0A371J4Z5_9FIRM|nr:hypothetical protein [Lachnotalea glycerini]RDY27805.1 hypothetical protein CG710_020190 [Lachnotalea glycerini]